MLLFNKLWGLQCGRQNMPRPLQVVTWRAPRALRLEVSAHVDDAVHRTPTFTKFKFIGLSVWNMWLIFGHGVKRPGDLNLWPLTTRGEGSQFPTPLSLIQQLSILANLLNLQTRPKWRCSCHRLVCWHRKPSFICRINCRILKDGERSGSLSGHRSKL